MDKNLSGYFYESEDFERCKYWCENDRVIVERIPEHYGYHINIFWHKPYKLIELKSRNGKNILWFHWNIHKAFIHKTGKIVYKSGE